MTYRFYARPKHENRIDADLLGREVTLHDEVGQHRNSYKKVMISNNLTLQKGIKSHHSLLLQEVINCL